MEKQVRWNSKKEKRDKCRKIIPRRACEDQMEKAGLKN